MNVYDAERMADVLAPLGYEAVDGPDGADLVILNTCHIREKATEKVFSELGRLRQRQDEVRAQGHAAPMLAVAGCVAQAEGSEITRRAPHVDMVFGPQTYHRLPEFLREAESRRAARMGFDGTAGTIGARLVDTDFPSESKFDHLPGARRLEGPAAFLTIQEGCDKFCSFCVVPYTRGAETSRPVQAIIEEAKRLLDKGAREITLLGQNVNAYHGEGPNGGEWNLARLLEALSRLSGVERLRYTTSHPLEMDSDLIATHRDLPALMPFLHLPVQSGSDRILAAMNRRHSADLYRRVIEDLRRVRPDMAFSSDFIVGFPGETEEDFEATLELVRDIGFAQAYSFKYSARHGTPAGEREAEGEGISEESKTERLARLQALIGAQQLAFNRSFIGHAVSVLVDRPGRTPDQLLGRSPWMQSVVLPSQGVAIGHILDCVIADAGPASLLAEGLARKAA